MLKRIKIRGKLLLLLITPLLAVLLFAASGVLERTDNRDASAGEAQIAEFAEATADLSTALQVERFQTLLTGRLMGAFSSEIRPDEIATDDALTRWRSEVNDISGDLGGTAVLESIRTLEADLVDVVDAERGERFASDALAEELSEAADRLNDVIIDLQSQSTSIELYQALDGVSSLIGVQESLADIVLIGDRSISNGTGSGGMAILVRDAITALSLAYDQSIDALESDHASALDQLVTDDMLPRLSGSDSDNTGGFDAIGEITVATQRGAIAGGVDWTTISQERLTAVNGVLTTIIGDAANAATIAAADSEAEAGQFLILAVSVVVLALVMAIVMGRSISRPLIQLTDNAQRLSSEELPAMVESMRTAGRTPAPSMTPIRVKGRDEVAQLGRAFADIQNVTVEVAEEQGNLLRRGISDIFVNLARRNQSLLDRQIDFIDQLESREENPDQLENLFRLDHLATRMRRNAESLLVLAGAEPTRRRGRPVELADVVRVAMGEIEDFSRIQLLSIDSATVAGSVAVDLAHLMSELMENATAFSPPDSDVEVVGHQSGDGTYQLTLSDRGIGMSAEQIATANQTLSEPPIIGLDLSRSLGFTVVSRLAHRLGVTVRLASSSEGGVTALVTVPADMIASPAGDDIEIIDTPPAAEPTVETPPTPQPAPEAVAPVAQPMPPLPPPAPPVEPIVSAAPEPVAPTADAGELAALPMRKRPQPEPAAPTPGDLFEPVASADSAPQPPANPEQDLFAALDGTPPPAAAAPPQPAPQAPAAPQMPAPQAPAAPPAPQMPAPQAPAAPPAPQVPAPQAPAAPPAPTAPPVPAAEVGTVATEVTSAGLIRRTPKQVSVPEDSKYTPGAAAAAPEPATMAPANRSPEEVRQMLSRYRAGLRKGRGPEQGTTPTNRRS